MPACLTDMQIPLYILMLRFDPHLAAPLANITIFGGSIANFLLNVRARHPSLNRPLIAYDVALMMEPLTIAGEWVAPPRCACNAAAEPLTPVPFHLQ